MSTTDLPVINQPVAIPADVKVLKKVKESLPSTTFVSIEMSGIPDWYKVKTESGNTFYVDKSGTYLVLGLVLNLNSGKLLDNQLEGTSTLPMSNGEF